MSTTTNFKRIALVAVAALGLGVLNSVPSQAAINADTVTLSAATASQSNAETYTATSAVVTVSFFGATSDSMSITAALVSAPAGNTALPTLQLVETSSALVNDANAAKGETFTANTSVATQAGSGAVVTTAKYAVYLTQTDGITPPSTVGSFGVKITPATVGASGALQGSVAQTLTITVTTAPTLDKNANAGKSIIYMQKGEVAYSTSVIADSSVVVVKTAHVSGAAAVASIQPQLKNAAGGSADESMTVTISGPGVLGADATLASLSPEGRSLSVAMGEYIGVFADGNAGTATITVTGSTSGNLLATKTVKFYDVLSSFTATSAIAIVGTTAVNAVTFTAKDSVGNVLANPATGASYYAFSSDTAVATVGTVAYSVDSGTVSVTGVTAGTATITVGNASTLAASTIKGTATIRVGSTAIASVKVAFDKATYAPGEKAYITVTPLDATNLPVVPRETEIYSTMLAPDKAFSQGVLPTSDTTTTFASATSATAETTAGVKTYVVYMPVTGGKVTITGTLVKASPLALAIQGTDVTASATVADSGSAALAAVTALATTVASLRTLIVTLTNLVLKIQKKVKA
jgi:hypothetical protein